MNEVYIPIPSVIHQFFPEFFPSRDEYFDLILPDGNILVSKLCQENSKALMSQSNKALGKWLLRDVLSLEEGTLLTYDKLQTIGVDAVRIDKLSNNTFQINFSEIGSYDDFFDEYLVGE